jgi:hypothetical protein
MASAFAVSPIQQPRAKLAGIGTLAVVVTRKRRKETVNERVEHILRGALQDAEEEALEEREGDPETRGRALQRSHQLASLYATSTENKFLRSRAKRGALLDRCKDAKTKRDSETAVARAQSRAGSAIGEGNESDASDDDSCSVGRFVLASPIKAGVQPPTALPMSPVKSTKPWYGCSPTATLKEQIPPGITLDAKLRRYGAKGTAKLLHGWRSQEALEPLSPTHAVAPVDEFVSGLGGSPSLWPPETFHPTGSRLRVTMTRCPSSPIAVSVERDAAFQSSHSGPCQVFTDTEGSVRKQAAQKLRSEYKREVQVAREERAQNQQDMTEWQSRTLHFTPSSELAAHREQQKADPQLRHRRTQASAIVQTPGYSPDKQRSKESSELKRKRFSLRWTSFSRLLDAMKRTPCRRPVLQDMEKLFALARELGALNARGSCVLSRSQFTLLVTREFPLCDLKHVNRLFSSYDWEIRDCVDARVVLGTVRAMRVQQGEPVELICASLRDFDGTIDTNGKSVDDKALVADSVSLTKALSLCCASDDEEQEMEARASDVWTKTLSWQRQILSRRLHGGKRHNVWKAAGATSSVSSTVVSPVTDSESYVGAEVAAEKKDSDEGQAKQDENEDEEETREEISVLTRLIDESRVPVRRLREALKRERGTLALFTQQLLQRRHECLVGTSTRSPRR